MHINPIAVLVAVVAGMIVGALWYGPLFGRPWRLAAGLPADHKPRNPGLVYGGTLVATAVTVTILAGLGSIVATGLGLALLPAALLTAVAVWLGASFARQLINLLFEGSSPRLFAINTGHDLAVMAVAAVIIGLFGI
ncbi:MAG: DUF1761 domain-containing protein [Microbacterium sp.]